MVLQPLLTSIILHFALLPTNILNFLQFSFSQLAVLSPSLLKFLRCKSMQQKPSIWDRRSKMESRCCRIEIGGAQLDHCKTTDTILS